MRPIGKIAAAAGLATILLGAGYLAVAQQQLEESKRARSVRAKGGTYHVLPATPETTQWGWFDVNEKPRLVVNSGDTVAIETMMGAMNRIQPGMTMEEMIALRGLNPGAGPHSVTGPIYVNGAEPGDVMEIRIVKIVPKAFAVNFNLPGAQFPQIGGLQEDFPQGYVRYFYLDWDTKTVEFKPGVVLDLKPFPGVLAVGMDPNDPARDRPTRVNTIRPWKNGSNMDLNELQEGSILYVPIHQKGGLIWTGDSHCRQGNGEVNLTALECAYREIVLQPIVRKDMKLEWPRVETPTHWVMVGFDEDLNKAFKNAVRETIKFLVTEKKLDPYEAYSFTSVAGDCRVTQVVDIRKGVHCMIAKEHFKRP